MPDRMPERMSKDMPNRMPEKLSEDMPQINARMSDATYNARKNVRRYATKNVRRYAK